MGEAATSAAAVRRLLWAHPPADADGESPRAAVWGVGRSFGPEKPLAWSGFVRMERSGAPRFQVRSGLVRGAPSVLRLELPGPPRCSRAPPTGGGGSSPETADSESSKFLGLLWGR